MAEYYPLLAKAIGSLPNSTPDSRRVVYERARKALIGQLRTLHPPIPDEDIERESVELDRAVERLEAELASGVVPGAPTPKPPEPSAEAPSAPKPAPKPPTAKPPASKPPASKPPTSEPAATEGLPPPASPASEGAVAPRFPKLPERKPVPPRPPTPKPLVPRAARPAAAEKALPPADPTGPGDEPAASPASDESRSGVPQSPPMIDARAEDAAPAQAGRTEDPRPLKPPQRPIAPQPPGPAAPRRQLWIIPAVVVLVIAIIAAAAWKLRDRPETLARKPAETTQSDSGKIAERVGGPQTAPSNDETSQSKPAATGQAAPAGSTAQTPSPNPEVPVARRAALLIEAPDEPNKVKTIVGNVVWKLNNAPQDANAAVGLAVEADVDLPEDKMKAIITFEKNSDASLPASHTIKIRFIVEPGSYSGGVKQISVPQMRPEASPNGEPLAGVTVQIVPNSFLVGLSPGNAEAANTDLMRRLQWVDVPMLLDNGKIAKLTFEKGESGQRDLNEAFEAWQK